MQCPRDDCKQIIKTRSIINHWRVKENPKDANKKRQERESWELSSLADASIRCALCWPAQAADASIRALLTCPHTHRPLWLATALKPLHCVCGQVSRARDTHPAHFGWRRRWNRSAACVGRSAERATHTPPTLVGDGAETAPLRVWAGQQSARHTHRPLWLATALKPLRCVCGQVSRARDEKKTPQGKKRLIKARHKGQRLRTHQLSSGTATPKRAPHKGATHTPRLVDPKQDEHATKCDE